MVRLGRDLNPQMTALQAVALTGFGYLAIMPMKPFSFFNPLLLRYFYKNIS